MASVHYDALVTQTGCDHVGAHITGLVVLRRCLSSEHETLFMCISFSFTQKVCVGKSRRSEHGSDSGFLALPFKRGGGDSPGARMERRAD